MQSQFTISRFNPLSSQGPFDMGSSWVRHNLKIFNGHKIANKREMGKAQVARRPAMVRCSGKQRKPRFHFVEIEKLAYQENWQWFWCIKQSSDPLISENRRFDGACTETAELGRNGNWNLEVLDYVTTQIKIDVSHIGRGM